MLKKGIIILSALGLTLVSCIKHEVIPAPTPMVDLYCYFAGNIGGDSTEFTQNVGYDGLSGVNYEDNFGIATTKYYFTMTPTDAINVESIGVMLGSISWSTASGASSPSIGLFNDFFIQNDNPLYMDNADNGFMVMYTDVVGNVWQSRQATAYPQDVEFVDIVQESDETGDYSKFTCNFKTRVYREWIEPMVIVLPDTFYNVPMIDSIDITNGLLKGWFKR